MAKTVAVVISDEERAKLDRLCRETKRTRSGVLRALLAQAVVKPNFGIALKAENE